jgi:hypothetical protein
VRSPAWPKRNVYLSAVPEDHGDGAELVHPAAHHGPRQRENSAAAAAINGEVRLSSINPRPADLNQRHRQSPTVFSDAFDRFPEKAASIRHRGTRMSDAMIFPATGKRVEA